MAVSEESAKESTKIEAETGFGTGLRGKLKKRQEPPPEADSNGGPPPPELEERDPAPERATAPPEPVAASVPDTAELDALRAELAASLDRERDLRVELAAAFAERDQGIALDGDHVARSGELDLRAAKVASAEQEIELREARLTEQLQNFREERERLSEVETRLTAAEALTGERSEQVESRIRELRDADREREKLSSELAKRAQTRSGTRGA
jgi:DNA repair exonuclease SbcCD ATPase subunit